MAKQYLDNDGLKKLLEQLKSKVVSKNDTIKITTQKGEESSSVETSFANAELTFKAEGDLNISTSVVDSKPVITFSADIPESENSIIYTIKAKETLSDDEQGKYAAVYQLCKQDGEDGNPTPVEGSEINIPLDFFVKTAELKTVETENQPVEGYKIGEKYIDFVIHTKSSSKSKEEHLYINMKDFIDVYTAGNGIEVNDNVISVKTKEDGGITVSQDGIALNIEESNGLEINESGSLTLNLATAEEAGAISSDDYTKLQSIDVEDLKKLESLDTDVLEKLEELPDLPESPSEGGTYIYTYSEDGSTYEEFKALTDNEITEIVGDVFDKKE